MNDNSSECINLESTVNESNTENESFVSVTDESQHERQPLKSRKRIR